MSQGAVAERVAEQDPIADELCRFASEQVVLDGRGLALDERLVASGRVDSLGLVQLLAFVADRWGVDLAATADAGDLETVATIAAAVRRKRG